VYLGFICIWEVKRVSCKNRGYIVTICFFILKTYIGMGVQQKDFWMYLSISSEIRGII
jgi:hypothetical protein